MAFTEENFLHLGRDGFHRIAYRAWGDPGNDRVLICVHGLSRNRNDFDPLATALEGDYRILALDMPGRGASDWLDDKEAYGVPLYLQVSAAAIARSRARQVDWVGTSMGGIIGMHLAAKANTPIRKLVINDIGPHVPAEGRRGNQKTFGADPRFATIDDAVAYTRETRAAFGPMGDADWRQVTEVSLRQLDDGSYALHYDPGLAVTAKREPVQAIEMWDVWDRISCPTLTIWGTESELLVAADVEQMKVRGPASRIVEVPGVGHAPPLRDAELIGAIRDFLLD